MIRDYRFEGEAVQPWEGGSKSPPATAFECPASGRSRLQGSSSNRRSECDVEGGDGGGAKGDGHARGHAEGRQRDRVVEGTDGRCGDRGKAGRSDADREPAR